MILLVLFFSTCTNEVFVCLNKIDPIMLESERQAVYRERKKDWNMISADFGILLP